MLDDSRSSKQLMNLESGTRAQAGAASLAPAYCEPSIVSPIKENNLRIGRQSGAIRTEHMYGLPTILPTLRFEYLPIHLSDILTWDDYRILGCLPQQPMRGASDGSAWSVPVVAYGLIGWLLQLRVLGFRLLVDGNI